MKNFAVTYMDFSENDLKLKIVEAIDWRHALNRAFPGTVVYLTPDIPLEGAREEAFNQGWLFNVIEIPTGAQE